MNLILLFKDDFIGKDRVRLDGRRLRHITSVHRAQVGDELTAGICDGLTGRGRITAMNSDYVEMEVMLTERPPDPLPLTLLLALPRPKVLRRTITAACSMGVKKIVLMNSFRVEKSFWKSPLLKDEAFKNFLIAGLEQARDTVMPEVVLRPLFKPFVEDELPGIVNGSRPLVAHPESDYECPRDIGCPVTLAVGPEGGFIPESCTAKKGNHKGCPVK